MRRTPALTGSIPRASQARSKKLKAGSTCTSTRVSARNCATLDSRMSGEPGTAYNTSPCSRAAITTASVIALYTSSNVGSVSYNESKLVAFGIKSAVGCRLVRTNCTSMRSIASSVACVTVLRGPGPRPTITTRAVMTGES